MVDEHYEVLKRIPDSDDLFQGCEDHDYIDNSDIGIEFATNEQWDKMMKKNKEEEKLSKEEEADDDSQWETEENEDEYMRKEEPFT